MELVAIQDFAVRLEEHSPLGHLVFMRAEDVAQVRDFLVHVVQHLPNGIDFHFSAFEALQRKANRQVLGELHQDGFVRLRVGRSRRQRGERLPQQVLGAARHLRHLLLKASWARAQSTFACSHPSEICKRSEYFQDFVFGWPRGVPMTMELPAPSAFQAQKNSVRLAPDAASRRSHAATRPTRVGCFRGTCSRSGPT